MKFLYRRFSTRQLVAIGLAVPVCFMILVGCLQWQSVNQSEKTRLLVRHTRGVQLALGIFRYSLSDAESCQFRYILTHNDANLGLYQKLLDDSVAQFQTLRALTADNAFQQKNLDRIESLLNDKMRLTAQSLSLEQSGDHAGALKIVSAEDGRLNMLAIESTVQDMQNIESALLFQRQASYQRNFEISVTLSTLVMAACLIFIIAILLLLRRLANLQSLVTLSAVSEMIKYEGGALTIEEYLKNRHEALALHGVAQVEAERILGLLEKSRSKPVPQRV
jgi:CHASE3 domain sensor protein